MAASTEKSVSLTDSDVQIFLERKEKPKGMYSVALVTAFLASEIENRRLEDLLQTHVAVYLKDFFCR